MENRAHALAAGLFVIVLCLCVAATAWWLSGKRELTRDVILVSQRSVNGLNPQAQVRYRGIRAGKVEAIELDPEDSRNILVRVSIDADMPLTRGTTARLNSQGITGLAFVAMDDDGSNPASLFDKEMNKAPRVALQSSPLDTLSERASEVANRLATLLDERSVGNLKRTIDNVAIASEGLKELPAVLKGVHEVLSEENIQRLQSLLGHLEKTMGQAAPLTAEVRGLVSSLKDLSRRFDQLADDAGGELSSSTLPRLNSLLGELQNNSRQLNRVLEGIEDAPQQMIFGRTPPPPGPGESGYKETSREGSKP